jgi:hypothetical protein
MDGCRPAWARRYGGQVPDFSPVPPERQARGRPTAAARAAGMHRRAS